MTAESGQDERKLQRYAHLGPAPLWRVRCASRCPRTGRSCTLEKRHAGPHLAHDLLRRTRAVWAAGSGDRGPGTRAPRGVGPGARSEVGKDRGRGRRKRRGKPTPGGFTGWLARVPDHLEGIFLLVLFLSFVGFMVEWAIRIARGG